MVERLASVAISPLSQRCFAPSCGDDAARRVRESGERIHLAAGRILDALLGPIDDLEAEAAA